MILESYCKLILHSGLISEKHEWEDCPVQYVYYRIAKRHQRKLQEVDLTIGVWINAKVLIETLQAIRDQRGDYLEALDSLIWSFEQYVE